MSPREEVLSLKNTSVGEAVSGASRNNYCKRRLEPAAVPTCQGTGWIVFANRVPWAAGSCWSTSSWGIGFVNSV